LQTRGLSMDGGKKDIRLGLSLQMLLPASGPIQPAQVGPLAHGYHVFN
jgi:hypothetical protein